MLRVARDQAAHGSGQGFSSGLGACLGLPENRGREPVDAEIHQSDPCGVVADDARIVDVDHVLPCHRVGNGDGRLWAAHTDRGAVPEQPRPELVGDEARLDPQHRGIGSGDGSALQSVDSGVCHGHVLPFGVPGERHAHRR